MDGSLARGSSVVRIALTLGLAVLADRLLFGMRLGINAALFLVAVVAGLLATRVRSQIDGRTRALSLALVGLAGSLAIDPGPLAVLLALLGVSTLALWLRSGSDAELLVWMGRLAALAGRGWRQPWRDATPATRQVGRAPWSGVKRGAGNWAVPVLLSLVFVKLFCIANPVLASWIEGLGTMWDSLLDRWLGFQALGRAIFAGLVSSAVWVWLRFRTAGWLRGASDDALSFREDLVGPEMVVRCLVMFNLVFAVQTAVDLSVLATGGALPQGMTFAEYAHRGAYPLIATALLAGLFVTVTFSSGQKAAEQRGARRLVFIWIAQNLVLLASTVYRHMLYVDAYGLTRWRLATIVWLGLVAAGFVLTARRIVAGRTNGWLLRSNAAVLVAVLYASCFVNWAGFIADHNAAHCAERGGNGPRLDISYLADLGPAALPALHRHAARTASGPQSHAQLILEQRLKQLRAAAWQTRDDWRSWSWRLATSLDRVY